MILGELLLAAKVHVWLLINHSFAAQESLDPHKLVHPQFIHQTSRTSVLRLIVTHMMIQPALLLALVDQTTLLPFVLERLD